MYIDDLFRSPGRRIAELGEMQLHLYRQDVTLQDYFLPLHLDLLTGPRIKSSDRGVASRLITLAVDGANKVNQLPTRRKIKADVLFCPVPYFERRTENQFLVRTLLGLAQTDAKILCLLPAGTRCQRDVEDGLAEAGRSGQITFLDPTPSSPIEARLCSMAARVRASSTLERVVQILRPHGLGPSEDVNESFARTAYFVELWERLAPWIEFDAVVARCHWNLLCSAVCRTGLQRGKPVITFQQGVIGTVIDVPVTASKYVAFGQPSASLLAEMNRRFFQAVGLPKPSVEYVPGGSLFDSVIALPDQFAQQALLLMDLPVAPNDLQDNESQGRALLELAEQLLAADLPLRRLVIRPHPHWKNLDLEACMRLVREHPTRCELSHPAWSLEDDLRRSSVVVGIWSGALTVASACGLPTIFLETEQGFKTADLNCFSPRQTLLPDAAFCQIAKMLTDQNAYAEARTEALRNACEYYAGGTNLDFSGAFFERLLGFKST